MEEENNMIMSKKEKQKYINDWKKENQDRVTFMVEKGKKDYYKAIAKEKGLSLNQFVIQAIENYIIQEPQKSPTNNETSKKGISYNNKA